MDFITGIYREEKVIYVWIIKKMWNKQPCNDKITKYERKPESWVTFYSMI